LAILVVWSEASRLSGGRALKKGRIMQTSEVACHSLHRFCENWALLSPVR
jgi:hypothetical protein